ncbi:MAG TPA: L,D-transpeptidase family protein [Candidatus Angelobacter sp.]|nr:L,D-transpeptidase family protein [Candidatus Angelobacter sp.]
MKIGARLILLVTCTVLTFSTTQAGTHAKTALETSSEIIVVTTADWDAVGGTLQRFQRAHAGAKWAPVGTPVQVVVGKTGLGWGVGVLSDDEFRESSDPVKKEGDGKAPAGVFSLGETFGYAAQARQGTRLPYQPLTTSIECVDDTSSKFYNRVVDRGTVAPDWNSSEHVLRSDELYHWGVVVDHNANPAKAGAGSCIFMHIWRGPGQGTVGCTAMSQEAIESLLEWLDPARKPLLVQMPKQQYRRVQKKWKLPALAGSLH